jgi:hypothetical protein
MSDKPNQRSSAPATIPLEAIEAAVKSIRFGVVQLVIQDGRIIQIDKTEKIRLA